MFIVPLSATEGRISSRTRRNAKQSWTKFWDSRNLSENGPLGQSAGPVRRDREYHRRNSRQPTEGRGMANKTRFRFPISCGMRRFVIWLDHCRNCGGIPACRDRRPFAWLRQRSRRHRAGDRGKLVPRGWCPGDEGLCPRMATGDARGESQMVSSGTMAGSQGRPQNRRVSD